MKTSLSNIVLALCALVLVSCKTPADFTRGTHQRLPEMRNIDYSFANNKNSQAKLLVIIPDSPDTNKVYYHNLIDYFYSQSYHIIVIDKPGGDTYKKRALDSREERIEDIINLLSPMDSLYSEELILAGVGEGAYVVPALSKRLEPSFALMINCGILSPLAELEYISIADSLSLFNEKLLALYGLDQGGLSERITNINKDAFGPLQLAPSSNRNWLSYYNSPLLNQLGDIGAPVLWYNYYNYPLCSVSGLGLLEEVVKTYPEITYRKLSKKQGSESVILKDLKSLINKH